MNGGKLTMVIIGKSLVAGGGSGAGYIVETSAGATVTATLGSCMVVTAA